MMRVEVGAPLPWSGDEPDGGMIGSSSRRRSEVDGAQTVLIYVAALHSPDENLGMDLVEEPIIGSRRL
jgi:hypothetical protein